MSKTPRTDKEVFLTGLSRCYSIRTGERLKFCTVSVPVVNAKFARQLETELSEATTEIKRLKDWAADCQNDLNSASDIIIDRKNELIKRLLEALEVKDEMNICYRIGKIPTEKLFRRLKNARKTIELAEKELEG